MKRLRRCPFYCLLFPLIGEHGFHHLSQKPAHLRTVGSNAVKLGRDLLEVSVEGGVSSEGGGVLSLKQLHQLVCISLPTSRGAGAGTTVRKG